MEFKYSTSIKFHQIDYAGIAFYGTAFELAHDALEEFVLSALQISKVDWFGNTNWIVPIKKTECTFLSPMKPFLQIDIFVKVESIGESSFCLNYKIMNKESLCAEVKTIHVFCDKINFSKINIPPQIKTKLQQFN
jgi:acyl-CoA thioesterase FadM